MENMTLFWEPGDLVQHPQRPDWGIGHIQSVINGRITANFREVGKMVIDGTCVDLCAAIEKNRVNRNLTNVRPPGKF